MIISMQKYSFLVYHKEYGSFLKDIQKLGVLHIIEKTNEVHTETTDRQNVLEKIDKAVEILEQRENVTLKGETNDDYESIISEVLHHTKKLDELTTASEQTEHELKRLEPWGEFSFSAIKKLNDKGVGIRFFIVPKKSFNQKAFARYTWEVIHKDKTQVYLAIFTYNNNSVQIEGEEFKMPEKSREELNLELNKINKEINQSNFILDGYAATAIPLLKQERENIQAAINYEEALRRTKTDAYEKVKILEGWVPESKKKSIDGYLEKNGIVYLVERASKNDSVPILLKNNKFNRLFEPIGKLFSLPAYAELDLTVFFAPFFMLFFGFCLGDAGYGLLFLIGAGLYKLKASEKIKPVLSLIQILGAATVLFGIISGTLFGINLIDADIKFLSNYKNLFLNPDNMFKLALVLGAAQIIFGIIIRALNQIKQFGFKHALSTIGWLFIFIGGGTYWGLINLGIVPQVAWVWYSIFSLGGFFILFFSDLTIGIPARVGKGVWDIYSTTTGLFGDLLSYIRLFALGLSSAILGFVINDIGLQILNAGPIIGSIFFVVFLIIGHGLNILISSLGSFVHPMRLTFVEFYKNAGFTGGGKEYKPFSETINIK